VEVTSLLNAWETQSNQTTSLKRGRHGIRTKKRELDKLHDEVEAFVH